jgi:hypothetical protein
MQLHHIPQEYLPPLFPRAGAVLKEMPQQFFELFCRRLRALGSVGILRDELPHLRLIVVAHLHDPLSSLR